MHEAERLARADIGAIHARMAAEERSAEHMVWTPALLLLLTIGSMGVGAAIFAAGMIYGRLVGA